jgi:hypothetical protein
MKNKKTCDGWGNPTVPTAPCEWTPSAWERMGSGKWRSHANGTLMRGGERDRPFPFFTVSKLCILSSLDSFEKCDHLETRGFAGIGRIRPDAGASGISGFDCKDQRGT